MTDPTPIITQYEGNIDGMCRVDVPNNLENVAGHLGRFAGVLTFGAWAVNMLISNTLGYNQDAANLGGMTFGAHPNESGIKTTLRVNVLRRNNSTVDLIVRITNVYQPGYRQDDEETLRGLYQDQVGVRIKPLDAHWEITQHAVAPATSVSEVNYQTSTQWGVEGGFESSVSLGSSSAVGAGSKAGGSYTFQIGTGTVTRDFDIEKATTENAIQWRSRMKNCYVRNHAAPEGYNFHDFYSLVQTAKGDTTRWFKDVPNAAKADLNLEYQGAWYTSSAKVESAKAKFEIVSTQRLMFGQVTGRWGLKSARLGGSAVMVPVYIVSPAILEIDFPSRVISLTRGEVLAYGIQDIGRPAMEQKMTGYKQLFVP